MKTSYCIDDVFERWPVRKAVKTLAVPAVASQMVTAVCSLTDTFFVGQTGSDTEIAAVSVSYTALLLLNTIANLFGIGGSSLLSRALGEHNREKASQSSAFSLWGAVVVSAAYAILMALFPQQLARLFGAGDSYLIDTCTYLHYSVVWGSLPSVLVMVFGHLVRAEGGARQAGVGLCLAGVANMVLDPLFIYPWGLNMGVAGAALATALSHWLSLGYFLLYMYRAGARTVLSLKTRHLRLPRQLVWDILSTGFPQSIKTVMSTLSGSVMNHLAAPFGEYVVAAIGVAHKFDLIPMNVATGFSAGSLPMIGYTYAARQYGRMKEALYHSQRYALYVSAGCMVVYLLFSPVLTGLFIQDEQTAQMGAQFLRVLSLALPGMTVSFIFTALFQATGRAREALIMSLYRKGAVDIPLLFLFNAIFPMWGLLLVQPVVDTTAVLLAWHFYKRFNRELQTLQGGDEPCPAKA